MRIKVKYLDSFIHNYNNIYLNSIINEYISFTIFSNCKFISKKVSYYFYNAFKYYKRYRYTFALKGKCNRGLRVYLICG